MCKKNRETHFKTRNTKIEIRETKADWASKNQIDYCFLGGCAGAGCWVAGAEEGCVFDCGVVAGATGVVAGVVAGLGAGFVLAGLETFWRTEPPPCTIARSARNTNAIAHNMNMTADHVVMRESTFAAPRGPNAVWLPAPPKAPARSAALPLCKSTTMMSTRQFNTKNVVSNGPAYLKPTTMIAQPMRTEIVHCIQPGISLSSGAKSPLVYLPCGTAEAAPSRSF